MPKGSTGPFADGLQYGCGTARFVCYALPHVLPAKHHFFRADERTRTADLISLGVCGQALPSVAEVCVRVRVKLGSTRPYRNSPRDYEGRGSHSSDLVSGAAQLAPYLSLTGLIENPRFM